LADIVIRPLTPQLDIDITESLQHTARSSLSVAHLSDVPPDCSARIHCLSDWFCGSFRRRRVQSEWTGSE